MNIRTIIGIVAMSAVALLAGCTNPTPKIAASGQDTTAKVTIEKAEIKVVTDSSHVGNSPSNPAR